MHAAPKYFAILIVASMPSLADAGGLQQVTWIELAQFPGSNNMIFFSSSSSGPIYLGIGLAYGSTTPAGMFRSTDHGATWDTLQLWRVDMLLCKDSTVIFCMGNSALVRSFDGGDSWQGIDSGWIANRPDIWAASSSGDIFTLVNTGQFGQGVYRSTDNGRTWQHQSWIGIYPQTLAIAPWGDIFVSGGTAGYLSRSTDLGVNWASSGSGLPMPVLSLVFGDHSYALANSYADIFRSTDGGHSWATSSSGISTTRVNCLAVDRHLNAFAGTDNGVYQSTDTGKQWTLASEGLVDSMITTLGFDSSGYLFAASSNGRIYRTESPTTGIPTVRLPFTRNAYLLQNYPNPFNPTTTINYEVQHSSIVKLSVYDVLGREVALLVNERRPPGSYEAKFDGANLPSGIYFYRLQTDAYTQTKKLALLK